MRRLALALAVLFAVACGSGDDDGAGSADMPATVAVASSPQPAATPTRTPTRTPTPRPTATRTPEPACSTDDGELAYDLLSDVSQRWEDAVALADSTPRMQLAAQISELQAIRRDVQQQDWPACAEDAQEALIVAMDAAIEGFIAFLGQEPDAVVSAHIDDYVAGMEDFATELAKLR